MMKETPRSLAYNPLFSGWVTNLPQNVFRSLLFFRLEVYEGCTAIKRRKMRLDWPSYRSVFWSFLFSLKPKVDRMKVGRSVPRWFSWGSASASGRAMSWNVPTTALSSMLPQHTSAENPFRTSCVSGLPLALFPGAHMWFLCCRQWQGRTKALRPLGFGCICCFAHCLNLIIWLPLTIGCRRRPVRGSRPWSWRPPPVPFLKGYETVSRSAKQKLFASAPCPRQTKQPKLFLVRS